LVCQEKNGNVVIVTSPLNETRQVSDKFLVSFPTAHLTSLAPW